MNDAGPLKIALPSLSFLPSLGGAEVGLHNIALRLKREGHTPVVITSAPLVARLRREGWDLPYEVVAFPPKITGIFLYWHALGFILFDAYYAHLQHRYGFDIWHGTMGFPIGVSLAHFASPRGIPHLVRCAGADIQVHKDIGYGMRHDVGVDCLIRTWLPRCDSLVAISESVVNEYHQIGVGDERIARIPNGVDLARFEVAMEKSAVRRRLGIRENAFAFLAVARNHPKKNLEALVRSANLLRQRTDQEFTVLIVGSGTEQLASLAVELDVERHINLCGEIGGVENMKGSVQVPTDTLIDIYRAADVFSFPSLLETFGIVLIEAMAAGLPVITTDAPGCRDVIRNGEDGLMVPVNDDEALTNAMQRLMDDDQMRKQFAVKSKARARDFSWDVIVDHYIDLYRAIISEKQDTHTKLGLV